MRRGVQSQQQVKAGRILLSDRRRMDQLCEERRALCAIILAHPSNEMQRRLREVQAQIEVLSKRLAGERI